jgi:hypothetical protein
LANPVSVELRYEFKAMYCMMVSYVCSSLRWFLYLPKPYLLTPPVVNK